MKINLDIKYDDSIAPLANLINFNDKEVSLFGQGVIYYFEKHKESMTPNQIFYLGDMLGNLHYNIRILKRRISSNDTDKNILFDIETNNNFIKLFNSYNGLGKYIFDATIVLLTENQEAFYKYLFNTDSFDSSIFKLSKSDIDENTTRYNYVINKIKNNVDVVYV